MNIIRRMKRFGGDSGTILIVDDEQKNIQVVGTMLAAFGYDFMVARDGEQALERVKAELPDLVLLDVYMPGKNGFEVCREFSEIEGMEEVPVIFLSADDDKNSVVKALESGGVDYVTKPFNKAELLARVRTHLELKKTRDECSGLLENAEKYLEVMAHDLKNWIGSAAFSSELLTSMGDLPDKAGRIAGTISESTGKALAFVEDFLANARASRAEIDLDIRSLDLHAICQSSIRMWEAAAREKGISLRAKLSEEKLVAQGDRAAVERILENLISNAIKFSRRGDTVTVATKAEPARVIVSDEGPGFSDEDREKLFEPYTRLSAKPTGGEVSTGLGLSIVKQLAERMEADIEVGNPQKGAEICLRFAQVPKDS